MGMTETNLELGYAHWLSFYHMEDTPTTSAAKKKLGFYSPTYGKWNHQAILPGGVGGSGVTGVFDASEYGLKGDGPVITALLAPHTAFMASSQASPSPGLRYYGMS